MTDFKNDLPDQPSKWQKEVENRVSPSMAEQGILALSTSASKITREEFLLLRVLWRADNNPKRLWDPSILPGKALNAAKSYLETRESWSSYLAQVHSMKKSRPDWPLRDIGACSPVSLYQRQVFELDEDGSEDAETLKAWVTPIAARTRSRARTETTSMLGTPTALPKKPVPKSERGLYRKAQAADPSNRKGDFKDPFTESPDSYSLSKHFEERLNLSDTLQEGRRKETRIRKEDLQKEQEEEAQTWEQSFKTPESFTAKPPHMSPMSPLDAATTRAACDEQIVNTALVLLLDAITVYHPDVKASWTLQRRIFHLSTRMEARTDGFLRDRASGAPLAILEVKAATRSKRLERIQMQESAQMAAWIFSQPEKGHLPITAKDGKRRRFIISQDHSEIYLTCAEYSLAYQRYLGQFEQVTLDGENEKAATIDGPFMVMRQFGPFWTTDRGHMEVLACFVLALTLVQSGCEFGQ